MDILIGAYCVVKTLLATLEAYNHFFHLSQISSQKIFSTCVSESNLKIIKLRDQCLNFRLVSKMVNFWHNSKNQAIFLSNLKIKKFSSRIWKSRNFQVESVNQEIFESNLKSDFILIREFWKNKSNILLNYYDFWF